MMSDRVKVTRADLKAVVEVSRDVLDRYLERGWYEVGGGRGRRSKSNEEV